jgi:hypothetical protein
MQTDLFGQPLPPENSPECVSSPVLTKNTAGSASSSQSAAPSPPPGDDVPERKYTVRKLSKTETLITYE